MSSYNTGLKSNDEYRISQDVIYSTLKVGLGWDMAMGHSEELDLDASCIAIRKDGSYDVVYYNRLENLNGSIRHAGDNLTGAGYGDDEEIFVKLSKVPRDFERLVFCVNIFGAKEWGQRFGQVSNAFIRMVDHQNRELVRHFLRHKFERQTFVTFAMLERDEAGWVMKPLGYGHGEMLDTPVETTLIRRIRRLESYNKVCTAMAFVGGFMSIGLIGMWMESISKTFFESDMGSVLAVVGGIIIGFCIRAVMENLLLSRPIKKVEELHDDQGDWIAQTVIKRLPS